MITRRRIVISLLLGVAIGGFYYAFTRPTDNQQPGLVDAAVRHVSPAPGDRVLRQSEIAIDLAAGYDAEMTIDERPIPKDQLDHIVGLNRFAFIPGKGKEIEELSPGRRCVVVELWDTTVEGSPHRTYSWCFEVH